MKRPVIPVVLLLLAMPMISIAQMTTRTVSASIPFEFHVGKEILPAGDYKFNLDSGKSFVTLVNAKSGKSMMAPVLTRISQWPGREAELVFDKTADSHYLAELHVPGIDGFHFPGAPGPHTHVSVKGSR